MIWCTYVFPSKCMSGYVWPCVVTCITLVYIPDWCRVRQHRRGTSSFLCFLLSSGRGVSIVGCGTSYLCNPYYYCCAAFFEEGCARRTAASGAIVSCLRRKLESRTDSLFPRRVILRSVLQQSNCTRYDFAAGVSDSWLNARSTTMHG